MVGNTPPPGWGQSLNGVIKCFNGQCGFFALDEPDQCRRPLTKIKECPDAVVKRAGKSQHWYFSELMSNQCACGKTKKPRKSFCYGCFKSLPIDMQNRLYRRLGEGYEAAYDEAVKYLEENVM